jgi:flagellar protein FliS
MMMQAINQYQRNDVLTASGVGVIILLYDGVIDFNNRAKLAISEGLIEERCVNINKSIAIIGELMNSLDMERGGEISKNLANLYTFMVTELTNANLNKDAKSLDTVSRLISELKIGWEGIRDKGSSGGADGREYGPVSARL